LIRRIKNFVVALIWAVTLLFPGWVLCDRCKSGKACNRNP